MRFFKYISAALLLLGSTGLKADCGHNTYKTNNFMIPVGRVVLNPEFENSNFAASALGEIGVRNYRAGATVGAWTTERTRLKISGEYLTQKLGWNFTTGRKDHWVHQGAGGFDWQYLMDDFFCIQAVDLKGYYSYSGSKKLSDGVCDDVFGVAPIYTSRRIAGANAIGGSFNTVFVFGDNHRLDVSLDYDNVKYRRKYQDNKKVHGLGGSFLWITRLPCCMDFALEGQFRRPFNYFGARLTWPKASNTFNSNVTLFGGWTRGKYSLPNSIRVGVELVHNFTMGGNCCETKVRDCCAPLWNPCDLNAWAMVPAVYMPEVLAIADECSNSISSTPIADDTYFPGFLYTNDVSGSFSSVTPLTYSATGLPVGVTIDPSTGVISGVINGLETYEIAVTATTGCSSVTQSFTLTTAPPPG